MDTRIDSRRLWSRLEALAAITDPERPYTRRSFSKRFAEGRAWLGERFGEAGLATRLDAAANLIGRREGAAADLAPIMLGSHSDTVPGGGRFDGIAGVLSALEVAQSLADRGIVLRHPIEIVDFLAEEPSDFGMSCVGSRLMAGHLGRAGLAAKGPSGETLEEAIRRIGGDPARLAEAVRRPGSLAAYVELHIEQGPILESRGIPIGVVTGIVGITRHSVTVEGRPDHAGNTPMTMRQDALVAASRLVVRAEQEASRLNREDGFFVATVGQLAVQPNASNVVPGRVTLSLEFRSASDAARAAFIGGIREFAEGLAAETGVQFSFQRVSDADPALADPLVMAAIRDACAATGNPCLDLPSGAGHDAMHAAAAGPMGMIFIPCRGGRSHCPEEWVEPEALAAGATVLYETVLALDRRVD